MNTELQLRNMDDFIQLGEIMLAGGLATEKNAKAAAAKLIVGHSLGLNAFESMRHLVMINGKPEISAEVMAGRIKSSGKYDYQIIKHDENVCIIEFSQGDRVLGVSEFSMDDARNAGLLKNPVWKSYPRNMLYARAISNGRRWYCPDVLNGAYVEEELQGEPTMRQAPPAQEAIEPPAADNGWSETDRQLHKSVVLEEFNARVAQLATAQKRTLWNAARKDGAEGEPGDWALTTLENARDSAMKMTIEENLPKGDDL